MNLENKTVFVTGANRGIGKALVESLLKKGVRKVYAGARDSSSLPNFEDDRVTPVKLDITDKDQIDKVSKAAEDTEILINNAGVAAFTDFLEGPLELIERDMNTNYYGTLNMIRSFVPVLQTKKDAAIVNVVTIGAFVNFPMLGGYCASKSALFSMSQGLRMQLAPQGINVHTVNPGPIDTDMAKDFDTEKTSPEVTAQNIVDELSAGTADIFPDPGGKGMFDVWKKDYRELENMVSQM